MRPIPLLTAIVVVILLYFAVLQREALFAFAIDGTVPSVSDVANPEKSGTDAADTDVDAVSSQDAEQPESIIKVVVMRSTARAVESAVVLRGETQAARYVDVRSETSGQVISDPLRKGTFVNKGDTLCKIDPGTRTSKLTEAQARLAVAKASVPEAEARIPTAQAQVETARAQLQEATINENAARKLAKDGYASDSRVASAEARLRAAEGNVISAQAGLKSAQAALLNAKASVESADAAIQAAQTEINRVVIKAPFEGLLESDTAELGSLLQPGALCATIIQLDPIKVQGYIAETEVDRVEVGALAVARLSSGEELQGQVSFLSRAADPKTRTFLAEINVPNPTLSIRSGQTAEIVIRADGTRAHLLPQSSLTLNDQGTLGVRTVNAENRVEFMPVTLIRDTVDGVWVSGLGDEENVITVGQEYVTEGVLVAPSFAESDK